MQKHATDLRAQMNRNPFLRAELTARFRAAVARVVVQPSTCVPGTAVLLSIADQRVATLRASALSRIGHLACLLQRLVSLCLSDYDDGRGVCVNARAKAVVQMRQRSSIWQQLAWARWSLMEAALLAGASHALFIDADVLLLRNPFDFLVRQRSFLQRDIVYHEELANCVKREPCSAAAKMCRLNSGLVMSSSARLCRALLKLHPHHFDRRTRIDQDIVQHYGLSQLNHTRCRLPITYAGQCSFQVPARGRPLLPDRCELVTYHTTCTSNLSAKLQLMHTMLDATAACDRTEVVRQGARRLHAGGHCCAAAELKYPAVGRMGSWSECRDACRQLTGCRIFAYAEKPTTRFHRNKCECCRGCDVTWPRGGYDSWELIS
tara:strand:+ start:1402 stop:2532 length:1131 start_codon:yes stop_codon:yes gene_type:complete